MKRKINVGGARGEPKYEPAELEMLRISIANVIYGNGGSTVSVLHKCMHNAVPTNIQSRVAAC